VAAPRAPQRPDHRVGEALVPSSMVHIELPQHALSVLAR